MIQMMINIISLQMQCIQQWMGIIVLILLVLQLCSLQIWKLYKPRGKEDDSRAKWFKEICSLKIFFKIVAHQ